MKPKAEQKDITIEAHPLDKTVTIVTLHDSINLSSESSISTILTETIQNGKIQQIIAMPDLIKLSPIAMGCLVNHLKQLVSQGGGLVIVAPLPCIKEQIFHHIEDNIFTYCSDIHEGSRILAQGMSERLSKKTLRFFKRYDDSTSMLLELDDAQNKHHIVQLRDLSINGMGCIYTGDTCPPIYSRYTILEKDGLNGYHQVELRYRLVLSEKDKTYKLGFKFLPESKIIMNINSKLFLKLFLKVFNFKRIFFSRCGIIFILFCVISAYIQILCGTFRLSWKDLPFTLVMIFMFLFIIDHVRYGKSED